MSRLDRYENSAYRADVGTVKINPNNRVLETDGFSDVDAFLTGEDLSFLKTKYNIVQTFIGYRIDAGGEVLDDDRSFYFHAFKNLYFKVLTHDRGAVRESIMTPILYKDTWYLFEDDLFITPEIREGLLKGQIENPFISKRSENLGNLVGMIFIDYDTTDSEDIEKIVKSFEHKYFDQLLNYMGNVGFFIKDMLKEV